MAKPVRLGFVGCGEAMAKPYMSLIEKLRARGKVELTAACDIVDKRDFVRDHFGIPFFTQDYRELIGRDDVDVVLAGMIQRFELDALSIDAVKIHEAHREVLRETVAHDVHELFRPERGRLDGHGLDRLARLPAVEGPIPDL